MQKAVGIVCEYNPLHEGHLLQLEQTRARFGEKPVVLVMSGNFVQRGEAAVADAYTRARAALLCGADLVLSLPFPYSTFSATGYATSALRVLDSLGVVDTLVFGAECEDAALLSRVADALCSPEFESRLQEALLRDGRTAYAHLRAETLDALCEGAGKLLRHPNNILAVEYLAAIKKHAFSLTAVPFLRKNEHSATALRARLTAGESIVCALPRQVQDVFAPALCHPTVQMRLEELLLASLCAGLECPELLALGARLSRLAQTSENFEAFLESAKTRKVTRARLRRGILHAYFGVEEEKIPPIPYTVLLAASEKGRQFLPFIYKEGKLPVYTKPSAPSKAGGTLGEVAALGARADSVYARLSGREGAYFLKQKPNL